MKVIGIVGSRRRKSSEDYTLLLETFFKVYKPGDTMVSGRCYEGADKFAQVIRDNFFIELKEHLPKLPANYKQMVGDFRRWAYAKAAYARNKLIAQDADVLIALVAPDRTGGTENTIKWFKKLHKGTRKLIIK